ncbi:HTTM domain-containing protein [Nocardioides sp. Y6]|uniref:HTTM domain-containing protein n=1 Tax=Nocardioides malaquae TaxID=2773426 RepID=A0ABR9RNZ9_9ACTN|nr:HTTM domain-containing protein [Nocardioides malaquae]MBE7323287.1 HTTM domain-containing protein [Nocardioides malaquae]
MLSPQRSLKLARMGLGVATFVIALESWVLLRLVAEGRYAMPVFSWVPPPTETTVSVYLVMAILSAVAITLGFHVTTASVVSTALSCLVLVWDQQTFSNHLWLALVMVALLAPAHAGASPRALGVSGTAPLPQWPLTLMKAQLSVCYAFAALSKLNPAFLSGHPLAEWMRWDLAWLPALVLSVATVIVELFLAGGLWFHRSRRLAVLLGFGLHASIVVMIGQETLALIAFSITCMCLYPLFLTSGASSGRGVTTSLPSQSRTSGRPF